MSRTIDMENLSDEDKVYLAQRAQLPTDQMSVDDQRALLDPETIPLSARANTGDVNTVNISKAEFAELLELRAAAEAVKDPTKLMKPEGEAAASADEDEEDEVEYADMTVARLRAEIEKRNEGRDEDEQMSLVGNKPELVARLESDDESDEE